MHRTSANYEVREVQQQLARYQHVGSGASLIVIAEIGYISPISAISINESNGIPLDMCEEKYIILVIGTENFVR